MRTTRTIDLTVTARVLPVEQPQDHDAPPSNIDRRAFMMRNAAIGAAAVMTGATWTPAARAAQAAKEAAAKAPHPAGPPKLGSQLSPELNIVKQAKEDAATVFQRMESDSVWQLPVVSDGRVLGIVSREALIRLFTRQLPTQTGLAGRP